MPLIICLFSSLFRQHSVVPADVEWRLFTILYYPPSCLPPSPSHAHAFYHYNRGFFSSFSSCCTHAKPLPTTYHLNKTNLPFCVFSLLYLLPALVCCDNFLLCPCSFLPFITNLPATMPHHLLYVTQARARWSVGQGQDGTRTGQDGDEQKRTRRTGWTGWWVTAASLPFVTLPPFLLPSCVPCRMQACSSNTTTMCMPPPFLSLFLLPTPCTPACLPFCACMLFVVCWEFCADNIRADILCPALPSPACALPWACVLGLHVSQWGMKKISLPPSFLLYPLLLAPSLIFSCVMAAHDISEWTGWYGNIGVLCDHAWHMGIFVVIKQ